MKWVFVGVKSARLIVAANFDLLRITNSRWWIYTATLGSAIVALMDVFSAIDQDLSEEEITEVSHSLEDEGCD